MAVRAQLYERGEYWVGRFVRTLRVYVVLAVFAMLIYVCVVGGLELVMVAGRGRFAEAFANLSTSIFENMLIGIFMVLLWTYFLLQLINLSRSGIIAHLIRDCRHLIERDLYELPLKAMKFLFRLLHGGAD